MRQPVARERIVHRLEKGPVDRLVMKTSGPHGAVARVGLIPEIGPQGGRKAQADAHRIDREAEAERSRLSADLEDELLGERPAVAKANAGVAAKRHPAHLDRAEPFMAVEAHILDQWRPG